MLSRAVAKPQPSPPSNPVEGYAPNPFLPHSHEVWRLWMSREGVAVPPGPPVTNPPQNSRAKLLHLNAVSQTPEGLVNTPRSGANPTPDPERGLSANVADLQRELHEVIGERNALQKRAGDEIMSQGKIMNLQLAYDEAIAEVMELKASLDRARELQRASDSKTAELGRDLGYLREEHAANGCVEEAAQLRQQLANADSANTDAHAKLAAFYREIQTLEQCLRSLLGPLFTLQEGESITKKAEAVLRDLLSGKALAEEKAAQLNAELQELRIELKNSQIETEQLKQNDEIHFVKLAALDADRSAALQAQETWQIKFQQLKNEHSSTEEKLNAALLSAQYGDSELQFRVKELEVQVDTLNAELTEAAVSRENMEAELVENSQVHAASRKVIDDLKDELREIAAAKSDAIRGMTTLSESNHLFENELRNSKEKEGFLSEELSKLKMSTNDSTHQMTMELTHLQNDNKHLNEQLEKSRIANDSLLSEHKDQLAALLSETDGIKKLLASELQDKETICNENINLKADKDSLTASIGALQDELQNGIWSHKSAQTASEEQTTKLMSEKTDLTAENENLSQKLKSQNTQMQTLQDAKREYHNSIREANEKSNSLESENADLQLKISKQLDSIDVLRDERTSIENDASKLQERIAVLEKRLQLLENELSTTQVESDDKSTEKEVLADEKKFLESKLSESKERITVLEKRLHLLEDELSATKSDNDDISIEKQTLKDCIATLEEKLRLLEEELSKATLDNEKLLEQKKSLEERIAILEEKLHLLEEELSIEKINSEKLLEQKQTLEEQTAQNKIKLSDSNDILFRENESLTTKLHQLEHSIDEHKQLSNQQQDTITLLKSNSSQADVKQDDLSKQLINKNDEINQINNTLSELQSQIEHLTAECENRDGHISELETDSTKKDEYINSLQHQLEESNNKLTTLQSESEALLSQLDNRDSELSKHLIDKEQHVTDGLAAAEAFSDIKSKYNDLVIQMESKENEISDLNSQLQEYSDKSAALVAECERLNNHSTQLHDNSETEQQRLQQLINEKDIELEGLKKQITELEESLSDYNSQISSLKLEIEQHATTESDLAEQVLAKDSKIAALKIEIEQHATTESDLAEQVLAKDSKIAALKIEIEQHATTESDLAEQVLAKDSKMAALKLEIEQHATTESDLAEQVLAKDSKIAALKIEIEQHATTESDLAEQVLAKDSKIAALKIEIEQHATTESDLAEQVLAKDSKISALKSELVSGMTTTDEISKEITNKNNLIRNLQTQLDNLQDDMIKQEDKIKALKGELVSGVEAAEEALDNLSDRNGTIESLRSGLESSNIARDELARELAAIVQNRRSLEDELTSITEDLSDKDQKIESLRSEIQTSIQSREHILQDNTRLIAENEFFKSQAQDNAIDRAGIAGLENEHQNLQIEKRELDEEMLELKKSRRAAESRNVELEGILKGWAIKEKAWNEALRALETERNELAMASEEAQQSLRIATEEMQKTMMRVEEQSHQQQQETERLTRIIEEEEDKIISLQRQLEAADEEKSFLQATRMEEQESIRSALSKQPSVKALQEEIVELITSRNELEQAHATADLQLRQTAQEAEALRMALRQRQQAHEEEVASLQQRQSRSVSSHSVVVDTQPKRNKNGSSIATQTVDIPRVETAPQHQRLKLDFEAKLRSIAFLTNSRHMLVRDTHELIKNFANTKVKAASSLSNLKNLKVERRYNRELRELVERQKLTVEEMGSHEQFGRVIMDKYFTEWEKLHLGVGNKELPEDQRLDILHVVAKLHATQEEKDIIQQIAGLLVQYDKTRAVSPRRSPRSTNRTHSENTRARHLAPRSYSASGNRARNHSMSAGSDRRH